jgi:polyisoprenyl-teichoic acid--peptidoglycan teichoic acid transferase
MVMRRIMVVILIAAVLLAGCNFPLMSGSLPTPIPISDFLINAGLKYPQTPTPFQPIPPTPTLGVPETEVPTEIPATPTEEQIISPIDTGLDRPKGQINILLLGSDWRPNMGYRTDVIMLLSLNPETGTATITSFPRDLYVELPGVGMERINSAQAFGGFELTKATFENNFDAHIDYYMMTNFYGFEGIINTLGGINVYAASSLSDECNLPQAVDKTCFVPAGLNTMNGATALWYVRSRHSSSDFDRTRRAQEVILAVFQKGMSLNAVSRAPELYDMFKSSVETNLPLDIIVKLLPLASKIMADPSIVRQYAIGPNQTYAYIVPVTGANVLIPIPEAVKAIILQALYQ